MKEWLLKLALALAAKLLPDDYKPKPGRDLKKLD